jgi:DNA-binding SARP family transcriptional activator
VQPTSVARVLRPVAAGRGAARSGPGLQLDPGLTVIAGLDHVASEDVAAALTERGRLSQTVWLRLERLDNDPRCLTESLTRAASFANMMRADRSTEAGSAFGSDSPDDVGRNLARTLSDEAIIVIEDDEPCDDTSSIIRSVQAYLEHADDGAPAVYLCHHALRQDLVRMADAFVDGTAQRDALDEAVDDDPGCTAEALGRLSAVVGSRSALINDIIDANALRDRELIAHLARGRIRRRSLLRRINARLLRSVSPAEVQALTIAMRTRYWHPSLGDRTPPDGMTLRPWMVPLEQEWWWLRPMWHRSLVRILDPTRPAAHHLVARSRATVPFASWRATLDSGTRASSAGRDDAAPIVRTDEDRQPARDETVPTTSRLDAEMFGVFELRIDGVVVPKWHGRLGPSILAYLLLQKRCVARDRLLDVFWPDVAPRIAQNRLRVAISSLRRALEAASPRPVIEFLNGNYRVARDGEITLDVDEFQRYAARGRHAEESNETEKALGAYRRALDLYRGELLAELPYEEWTMLPREALRVAYLDCLANASHLHLRLHDYSEALNLAWRILDADPAREDAHCLIMRCHAAQGSLHQARRQFDLCRHELITVLGVEPAPDTVELMCSLDAKRR